MPSGVSSGSEASSAASASACSVTPGAGTKASAMRLPKVIVPVLSSSSVSTSPAASTARPDFAITFARTSRSMPAMPIADSRPPIVVGISVTKSATRKTTGIVAPEKRAKGSSVTTTKRKISVKPTSRMSSAISFGVFCRSAPSTSAIMRSRKLLPGSAVTLTTSQSETTRVPPVTAERSPPDSRITGADSPVIALSSTEATPWTISPSAGMMSPASTSTTSPRRRPRRGDLAPGVARRVGAGELLAGGLGLGRAQRGGLRLAAALGDGLGEVGEEHGQPEPDDDLHDEAVPGAPPGEGAGAG